MVDHISREQLIAYRKKKLHSKHHFVIRQHLDSCRECSEEFEALSVGAFFAPYVGYMQKTEAPSSHLTEEIIKEFWEGTITDKQARDEILEHFLKCKKCDSKFDKLIKKSVSKKYKPQNKHKTFTTKTTAAFIGTIKQILCKRIKEKEKENTKYCLFQDTQDTQDKRIAGEQTDKHVFGNNPRFILRAWIGREFNWVKIHIFPSHLAHPSRNTITSLRIWVNKLWRR